MKSLVQRIYQAEQESMKDLIKVYQELFKCQEGCYDINQYKKDNLKEQRLFLLNQAEQCGQKCIQPIEEYKKRIEARMKPLKDRFKKCVEGCKGEYASQCQEKCANIYIESLQKK